MAIFPNISIFDAMRMNFFELSSANITDNDIIIVEKPDRFKILFQKENRSNSNGKVLILQENWQFEEIFEFSGVNFTNKGGM